ncbi:DNA polymerase epsilon catalytic subunit A isoform X2 [Hydra vulgaris]|uniref:DNA polymerase epsilon catalytic subunit n=1 Tax=Hydra vulgaris TaxID=6087 RepID=A0ABM4B3S5_HYDVU
MVLFNSGKWKKKEEEISDDGSGIEARLLSTIKKDSVDAKYGFTKHKDPVERCGWLINMHPTEIQDEDKKLLSAVDYYFIQDDGNRFKVSLPFNPYFYIAAKEGTERELATYLNKKYAGLIASIETVEKEDLDLLNHLTGLKKSYIKLSFYNEKEQMKLRKEIQPLIKKNKEREKAYSTYTMVTGNTDSNNDGTSSKTNLMDNILDIREFDVPYHVRVSIDLKIFVGHWYKVKVHGGLNVSIKICPELLHRPDPVVMAFDIETTKLPLKFPDSAIDSIMMISYMVDGQGYLITNREIVSEDIEDFEYTPRPEYEGPFIIFNEPDEASLLRRWFDHILEIKPNIFVTYNGDFFDWPFIDARAKVYEISMIEEIGFSPDAQKEYKSTYGIHMDAFRWVQRDSYLPVGSQNLKAVTKAKLRYNPVEVDPEDMVRMTSEQPKEMASYSVSDAVATYYLYMQYVHPFIFALCTIIPMEPDEILRKGSGTLCEALLMVEAFHANIIFPNKQEQVHTKFYEGHLLETETYVGGHVEALESGVFRSDIPCKFRMVPEAFQGLIDNCYETLKTTIENEHGVPIDYVTNIDELCKELCDQLATLRDTPNRLEKPLIYHLDVAAMYPNIILTNRLQPSALVDEVICASCDFNRPGARCQRKMTWMWRGDFSPANYGEYQNIKQQLEVEKHPGRFPNEPTRSFHKLSPFEQAVLEKKRLSAYSHKAYKKVKITKSEVRESTICQRENAFYIDTVRAFRDRRYEFKDLLKVWKNKVSTAKDKGDPAEIKYASGMEVLYDSLQLAHKCILNSFYGYVMRKGSRWFSMEMAGIVCYTGAHIITAARELVEQIGRPLELDTDGIWCILPASFPENFQVKTTHPKKPKITISYPGAMLNYIVQSGFTNDQYHDLINPEHLEYKVRSENSIFFEVDGPYKAMILPASKEEGKKLKKRYAVFNEDGTLAELKGFEVKRRGELQLIKIFQSSVFESFLEGKSLESVYSCVAKCADYWLDVLYSKGETLPDNELFELISENRSMSRSLDDYGSQKSTSISTAKRLAEFLGDQMVKDKGLSCRFIISCKPEGSPVTERAIPLAIFQTEDSIKKHYLKRWLKVQDNFDFDIRNILDWNYYIDRLNSCIQKIITIPAAMQGIANPVPRCRHPDWLHKRLLEKNDVFQQKRITDMFSKVPELVEKENSVTDLEDIVGKRSLTSPSMPVVHKRRKVDKKVENSEFLESDLLKSWREVLGSPPSMGATKEDQHAWILFHKRKWLFQKLQRNAARKSREKLKNTNMADNFGDIRRVNPQAGLSNFFKKQTRSILECHWEIIQIAETDTPGIFNLFVMVNNDLHSINVTVPRVFYVNSRKLKSGDGATWRKVNKILPRSQPSFFLYEYSIPEVIYKDYSSELVADLSSPDFEGIYETHVPLDIRAVTKLGCLCKVHRNVARALNGRDVDSFDISQLDYKTLAEHSYLESQSLKHLFFYHAQLESRAVFVIFLSPLQKVYVFILNTVRSNQMPNLSNMYTTERTNRILERKEQDEVYNPPETVSFTFDVQVETDSKILFRNINRVLTQYQDEKKGPTMILMQAQTDQRHLKSQINALKGYPIVEMPKIEIDISQFTALDWQRQLAKRFIHSYLDTNDWLEAQLLNARYFHIPIGNIPSGDAALYAADIFYARHLQKHNHLLWMSSTDRPDLGGKEEDDNRIVTEIDEGGSPEINQPGCYSTVCVELSLDAIAVNTVLQSQHIHDAEGVDQSFDIVQQASLEEMLNSGPGAVSNLTTYDEGAACSASFRILKSLVFNWFSEVVTYKNPFADNQLIHFYRYIRSPEAMLYDPALCRFIHGLMKKYFMQLISEFKKLGSTIVYASFNKIILNTKKRKLKDGLAYVQYIMNSILSKMLFKSIRLEPKACWEYLLWMDKSNQGGIYLSEIPNNFYKNGELCISTVDDEEDTDHVSLAKQKKVEMNWNICKFLPTAGSCQNFFQIAIAGHIHAVYVHIIEEAARLPSGVDTPVKKRGISTQLERMAETVCTPGMVQFSQERIQNVLTEQLFGITQKIHRSVSTSVNKDGDPVFPLLAGSYLPLKSPALEFVKAVCQVLRLDVNIQSQVDKLKRDLLKLIGVGSFADEANFQDPCMSLVVPEVICEYCNSCRDLDLCRDACITPARGNQPASIRCSNPECGVNYSLEVIEQHLISMLMRRSMTYTLQDLKCTKCKMIKDKNMSKYCDCAGTYSNNIPRDQFMQKLKIYENISKHYHLENLSEMIEFINKYN